MELYIQISLAVSISIALIGTLMILGIEKKNKVIMDFLHPKTKLTKKMVYATTILTYLYFGFGCFIQLYKQFI